MSWIAGLAGKAEDFLNKVDKSAATALHTDLENARTPGKASISAAGTTSSYSPYFTQTKAAATRPDSLSPNNAATVITNSVSVPSNLHKMELSHNSRSAKRSPAATPAGSGSARQSPVRAPKKDKDEELFEFLNSKESATATDCTNGAKKKTMSGNNGKNMLNGHSRQSSNSSTTSTPTGAKTPEPPISISVPSDDGTPSDKLVNGLSDGTEQTTNSTGDDLHSNHDTSSGYISNQDDGSSGSSGHLSSLELENRLLKNEVTQLNQEMTSVIQRAKEAQDDLLRTKKKLEQQTHHMSKSDQVIRELGSKESDLQEALGAKDAQLAVLRVRLEEADKELLGKRSQLERVIQEKERVLTDHTSATGVHSQALDTVKEKLQESEASLRREQETLRKIQEESMRRQAALESEKQHLSREVSLLQKRANEDRVKYSDSAIQLKTAKGQVDAAKQELSEYKEKATRILQSKDKLIGSLKEGGSLGGDDSGVMVAELEDMRQERDMMREEVHRSQMTVENLRTEIGELEVQLQQDSDSAQDQITSLQEQFTMEKERREDAEQEVTKQKQELRYAHEEMVKQKSAFQFRIKDREAEIERLRGQLTTKNMSTSSQAELENRLHTLTESLIQKQTVLEALSTEKNSLVLQLERMERQYREAESSAQRATATSVNMNDDDEVRNRMPLFMRESPLDGDVTRRVKRAANTIDRFSMKIGVFLRRYPIARIFVILYMALLHFWVSIVLLTYKPEVHGLDYQPQPPL